MSIVTRWDMEERRGEKEEGTLEKTHILWEKEKAYEKALSQTRQVGRVMMTEENPRSATRRTDFLSYGRRALEMKTWKSYVV